MNRFTDRTVVVTGGGGGIGTAVCTSFAEEGAKVAVLDRNESAAASTAQAITDAGGTAIAIGCDIGIGECTGHADRYVDVFIRHRVRRCRRYRGIV